MTTLDWVMKIWSDETSSDATELDVTDIVTMAKGAEEKAGEAKDTLDQQSSKIDDLLTKLTDLGRPIKYYRCYVTNY